MSNVIPQIGVSGSFVALSPFDQICDPKYMYTVEAIRTVDELNIAKVNTYLLVGEPVGMSSSDTKSLMEQLDNEDGAVITLVAAGAPTIHVPSTYFKSFPLLDGVLYERLCYIVDLGAVPPSLKDELKTFQTYLKDQTSAITGISEPEVHLGTVPTKSYVSREQNEVFENTRRAAITKDPSDAVRVKQLEEEQVLDRAYIAVLEEQLRNLQS
ncbi:hypothetical protein FDJ25_gp192 [Vibrio phage Aphrodite1]|uniref:Uncharacterized protein n=1 Tax=Vibrio phage Aphrodite1 TaxID=2070057 RepID=A0A2I7QHZ8_9CAUD|nr:hypothetical protein FDJ25_gp192 [Vibrio phage Aphrodite1]AUR81023.1 hypothetical protein Aphrodite1_0007 [Vibrio phage Aphrodite1]